LEQSQLTFTGVARKFMLRIRWGGSSGKERKRPIDTLGENIVLLFKAAGSRGSVPWQCGDTMETTGPRTGRREPYAVVRKKDVG